MPARARPTLLVTFGLVLALLAMGYVWLRNIDETNKWLFRKFDEGRSFSAIHVHAWVGWDVEFHERAIWDGIRRAVDDPEVMVPSREDAVLINAAHALYESMHAQEWGEQGSAPTGFAVFGADTIARRLIDPEHKIEHWSEFEQGGHFPAMEVPDLLVGDIREFFSKLREVKKGA